MGEREGKRRDEVKGRDGKYGKGENVRRLSRGLNIDRMIQALGVSFVPYRGGRKWSWALGRGSEETRGRMKRNIERENERKL